MSQFKLIKKLDSGIRICELHTPHGVIHTPFFMPVGTVGSVKGVSPRELEELGAEIVLSNTYHLYLRPGEQTIKQLGGLHTFMCWDKPILTDSGGYQVFSLGSKQVLSLRGDGLATKQSLAKKEIAALSKHIARNDTNKGGESLVKITEEGAEFKSHLDGSKHLFTPEKVIQIQLDLGVDILMPLDVCPSGKASREEIKEATERTVRWAERAKRFFDSEMSKKRNSKSEILNPKENKSTKRRNSKIVSDFEFRASDFSHGQRPLLHGIVQGGLDLEMRRDCANRLMDMDFDGYSVGGLAVDLETRDMWEVVKLMGEILPENKQRYLMGVGTPDDIIQAAHLGMDMFDCVLPTRLARHGSVYIKKRQVNLRTTNDEHSPDRFEEGTNLESNNYALLNLLNAVNRTDGEVIDPKCQCYSCASGFSKAYISHLLRSSEILGLRLATLHNLYQYLELMRTLRR